MMASQDSTTIEQNVNTTAASLTIDWDAGLQLYYIGCSNAYIAEYLGCSEQDVERLSSDWANETPPYAKLDWHLAKRLQDRGETDAKIAARLGCLPEVVSYVLGCLPKLWYPGRGHFNWSLGQSLYNDGFDDKQIAHRLGCSPTAVSYQRQNKDWEKKRQRLQNKQAKMMQRLRGAPYQRRAPRSQPPPVQTVDSSWLNLCGIDIEEAQ